jgi:hypothetical protein
VREASTAYRDAPEVEELAWTVIKRWHPHLRDARIRYLWREGAEWRAAGKTVLAKATKLGAQAGYLSGDFDATVIVDTARWAELNAEQRTALIDHELLHLRQVEDATGALVVQPSGRPVLRVVGHEVEAFVEEIQRHGLWHAELVHAGKAIRKLPIPLPIAGD